MTDEPVTDQQRVLVFDADDTLWETNLHFTRTFETVVAWLSGPTSPADPGARRTPEDVQRIFSQVEQENVRLHGYGTSVFVRNLRDTFSRAMGREPSAAEAFELDDLTRDLLDHRVEPMPGTADVLVELGNRNRLFLLTKGPEAEQRAKIDTSGLAGYFEDTLIVAEKDVGTYKTLIAEQQLDPGSSWMIGNSPMSDINPARAAGLNAVLIPNPYTWTLERAEVDPTDQGILHLTALAELTGHF